MRVLVIFGFGLIMASLFGFESASPMNPETPVSEALLELGDAALGHYINKPSEEDIARGKDLIFKGNTENPPKGKSSTYISKFFNCTSCHNTQREDLSLNVVNTDERLQYAKDNNLPYLQGSTFWGIYNRESWYNDDYVLKYGSLVEKAKNSLIESTQLCATVCSAGRLIDDWEMQAIMAYFYSIQLTLADLNYSQQNINELLQINTSSAIADIKSRYLQKSPATFGKLPKDKEKGYDFVGRPDMGKVIYEQGCQHCHRVNGESDVVLDDYATTFKWLEKNIQNNNQKSIYEIIIKGTYSAAGHQEYMPHYTEEKMSYQQIEDLRAYIEQQAAGK